MKKKLIDLDPHMLKRVAPLAYEHTDDVRDAEGLQLWCPACDWASDRIGGNKCSHTIILWGDAARWGFVGRDYRDLSLMAGRTMVTMTGGPCRAQFYIRDGRVDFN